jgi:hypothetical protein
MSSNDLRLAEAKIKAKHDNQLKAKQSQLIINNTQSMSAAKKGSTANSTGAQIANTTQLIHPSPILPKVTAPVVNAFLETNKQHLKQPVTKLTQDQTTSKALTQFLGFLATSHTK